MRFLNTCSTRPAHTDNWFKPSPAQTKESSTHSNRRPRRHGVLCSERCCTLAMAHARSGCPHWIIRWNFNCVDVPLFQEDILTRWPHAGNFLCWCIRRNRLARNRRTWLQRSTLVGGNRCVYATDKYTHSLGHVSKSENLYFTVQWCISASTNKNLSEEQQY